jgi:hypothetical protein
MAAHMPARRRTQSSGKESPIKAVILNCTLKPSPETSNTEALAGVVIEALEAEDVTTETVRVVAMT